jgi:hypothetical protein
MFGSVTTRKISEGGAFTIRLMAIRLSPGTMLPPTELVGRDTIHRGRQRVEQEKGFPGRLALEVVCWAACYCDLVPRRSTMPVMAESDQILQPTTGTRHGTLHRPIERSISSTLLSEMPVSVTDRRKRAKTVGRQ